MENKLDYKTYFDCVKAGWLGKSIGGVIGAPYENHKQWHNVSTCDLWPDKLYPNDDLDIQVVWLEALQERGIFITHKDLVDYWQDRCHYNFCEYGHFLYNVQRGIMPPVSGYWNNEYFMESEGCPIRAEIWGYICPGNPELAAHYATLDAELDHTGASVRIERFLAAANAQACITDNLEEAIQAGLSVIPDDCPEALAVANVRQICQDKPEPFQCWRKIIRQYGDRDASKAITNHAIVLMALFLGEEDFTKTIQLCVNAGWDTDCTAATAGALLGALGGVDSLPEEYLTKLGPNLVCNVEVKHKNASIEEFTEATCHLGVEVSALRSKIELENAPEVTLRSQPPAKVELYVEYCEAGPVLYAEKTTSIIIHITNPTKTTTTGSLVIKEVTNTTVDYDKTKIELAPGASKHIKVTIIRDNADQPIPDKNLFRANFNDEEVTFGLGGANQWLAYGPYWNMWDIKENEICPYYNEQTVCLPNQVGLAADTYNHYVYLDHQYLDEEKLLVTDLPEELPFYLEKGMDLISEKDLGGFNGAACYYLTRTIQAPFPINDTELFFGRSTPVKVWLDGKLIFERSSSRSWAVRDESIKANLTGKPQRLIVKMARQIEVGKFSVKFLAPYTGEHKKGISNMLDCLCDHVPQSKQ